MVSRGVFFDVYDIDTADGGGKTTPLVFKDFRVGDVIMSPKDQVSLFQHQYYEWNYLRERLGHEFFPESYWMRSSEFTDDEAHGFYSDPGRSANTMREFLKVQLDRQLANRYNRDDGRRSALKKVLAMVGESAFSERPGGRFIGAVIQEKVRGIPFSKAIGLIDRDDPNYGRLRQSVSKLIAGLRDYHDESDKASFTWHSLDSDNVMAETDDGGRLTGRVLVVDANFIERPNKTFKEAVVKKLEKNVLEKLEGVFDL